MFTVFSFSHRCKQLACKCGCGARNRRIRGADFRSYEVGVAFRKCNKGGAGVFLAEGKMAIRSLRVRRRRRNSTELEIRLHGGANRQIRRVLAKVGHPVTDLRRVAIGPLRDPALPEGACRRLTPAEVASLRQAVGLLSQRSKPR